MDHTTPESKPTRRILILSTSVGAGHVRAAEAVREALLQIEPHAVVKHFDTLSLASSLSNFYRRLYTGMAAATPHLLGYLYDRYDRRGSRPDPAERFKLALEQSRLSRLRRLLTAGRWDAVINTHILPAGVIAAWRRRGQVHTPHMTVTTDFQTHRFWVNEPTDHYFTATAEGADYLQALGVPAERISATGIPISAVFARVPDRGECRARHGLSGDRPIILQLGGGIGFGPVEQLYRAILAVPVPLQIVSVAGRNEPLRQRLDRVPVPPRHRAKVLGFTDRIHELMAAADLMVGKPGGLSASEALACGLALVLTPPIPGQEAANCDHLLENGVAVKINNPALLPAKLTALLADPKRLARLRKNARKLARPQAALAIARKVLALTARPSGPSSLES